MRIALIIVHYGPVAVTKNCLLSLAKKISSHRVIIVNNTVEDLSSLAKIIPGTKVIAADQNQGYAHAANLGIKLAQKDKSITHYFILNNDLTFSFGSLEQLLMTFTKYPRGGIVSPVLHHQQGYDWGGKYNKWSGMVKHKNWDNKPKTTLAVEHVAGAAMLLSREAVAEVGIFDELFFMYFEDLDLCLRFARGGYTIHICPDVVVEHTVSASSSAYARTRLEWVSHFTFVTKHLFRLAYPTAYLYDIFIYPLWLLKSLVF